MDRLRKFIHKNRVEVIVVALIAILTLGLRLYKIDGFMTFLGDEGRDVRIVRNILRGDLAFIGPQTSIGNMYLGPLYYYMMAPALFIWGLNPVGPAVMVAFLGAITVLFTWWVGRTWFNPLAGIIAACLFALAPVAIIYSRSSWNPNPMPFFALLCIWGIWQVYRFERWRWLPIVGISLAFALQMHYLGLLLIPPLVVYWFLALKRGNSTMRRQGAVQTAIAIGLFLFLMSPLVLFDLKHDFANLTAFRQFLTDRQTTVNLNPGRSDRFLPVIFKITDDLVLGSTAWQVEAAAAILVGLTAVVLFKDRRQPALKILLVWLGFAWLGLSLYKQHVYAHYFGFIFPAVYLLLGLIFSFFWRRSLVAKILSASAVLLIAGLFISNSPLRFSPNNQLARTKEAVSELIAASEGKEFNFGLIAKQNYDESYRYFFEQLQAPLVRGEDKLTDQLFVICEDGDACQPLNNPAYQIAIFGPATIESEWRLDYLHLYKLGHTLLYNSK